MKLEGRDKAQELIKTGSTGFIPNVVLLKPDGTMISNDKAEVMKKLNELVEG
ncbi:hypothetical protein OAE61_03445 [Verrucomicrobiales bacterium]|nr:hypothetical protein [Verrucomicrobiales bacterium]